MLRAGGWYGQLGFVRQLESYEERVVVITVEGGGRWWDLMARRMSIVGFSLAGAKVKFVLVWVTKVHGLGRRCGVAPAQL